MKTLRFCLLFVIATAFTSPPKDLKLVYTFKVGDQYNWTQTSKQEIKQNIPGMGEITVNMDTETAIKFKVLSTTATGARFEIQYTKLKMVTKSSMGMGDSDMDSESTADDMQTKLIRSMMNKPFFFNLSSTGVVERVEGSENLYSGFKDLGLDSATIAGAKASLQQMLGEKSLKGSLEMAFVSYPKTGVKTGASWNSSNMAAMSFPVKIDNVWTLKDYNATTANINAKGTLITTDKQKVTNLPNGIKSKMDLAGNQIVTGAIDLKTGFANELKVESLVEGMMTLLAGGMIPQDMEVPMSINSTVAHKIVKQ